VKENSAAPCHTRKQVTGSDESRDLCSTIPSITLKKTFETNGADEEQSSRFNFMLPRVGVIVQVGRTAAIKVLRRPFQHGVMIA
jgi:hypothetical protein